MEDSLSYPSSQNSNTKFAHLIIIARNNSEVCSFSFAFRFLPNYSRNSLQRLPWGQEEGGGGADRGEWPVTGGRDVT